MRRSSRFTTAVLAGTAVAAFLLAGCTAGDDVEPGPDSADTPAETEAVVADETIDSITGIDVCGWVRAEATMPYVIFGAISQQEVPYDAQQDVVVTADGAQIVSCDIQGYNDEFMSYDAVVGTVTLMLGGPEVDTERLGSAEALYSYREVEGISVVGNGVLGAAKTVVQLEPGVSLSVEGFIPSFSEYETVANLGVLPLMSRLIDGWAAEKVPTIVAGSFADASNFCTSANLTGLDGVFGPAAGDGVAAYARGGLSLGGSNPGIGSITCGLVSYNSNPNDQWEWNAPETFPYANAMITLTNFADEVAASQQVSDYTFSSDGCSGAVMTGTPANPCADASGMASRRGSAGPWTSLASAENSTGFFTMDVASTLAAALDTTAAEMLSKAGSTTIQADADSIDPRVIEYSQTENPPAGSACADGQETIMVQKTELATLSSCYDPGMGQSQYGGTVDGVAYALPEGRCGQIDATKWGGPPVAEVCAEDLAIHVAAGQDVQTTYFREYYAENWTAYMGDAEYAD